MLILLFHFMGCFCCCCCPKEVSISSIIRSYPKFDSDDSRTESTVVYDWDVSAQSSTSSCTFCLYWSFLGSHTCAYTPPHTHTEGGSDLVFLNGTNCGGLPEKNRITRCHPIKQANVRCWAPASRPNESYAGHLCKSVFVRRSFGLLRVEAWSLLKWWKIILNLQICSQVSSQFSSRFQKNKYFSYRNVSAQHFLLVCLYLCLSSPVSCLSGSDLS